MRDVREGLSDGFQKVEKRCIDDLLVNCLCVELIVWHRLRLRAWYPIRLFA